jgi:hypothetical protein
VENDLRSSSFVITRPFTVSGRRTRLGQGASEQENDSVIMEESSCDGVEERQLPFSSSELHCIFIFVVLIMITIEPRVLDSVYSTTRHKAAL